MNEKSIFIKEYFQNKQLNLEEMQQLSDREVLLAVARNQDGVDTRLTTMEAELRALREFDDVMKNLKARLTEVEAQNKTYLATLGKVTEELTRFRSQMGAFEELAPRVKKAAEDLERIERDVAGLNERLNSLVESNNANLKELSDSTQLSRKLAQMGDDMSSVAQKVADMRSDMKDINRSISNIEKDVEMIDSTVGG